MKFFYVAVEACVEVSYSWVRRKSTKSRRRRISSNIFMRNCIKASDKDEAEKIYLQNVRQYIEKLLNNPDLANGLCVLQYSSSNESFGNFCLKISHGKKIEIHEASIKSSEVNYSKELTAKETLEHFTVAEVAEEVGKLFDMFKIYENGEEKI